MIYLLYVIFFVSCLALIVSVLLQPGKTDAGALFTSNISSSAFSPRGTATVLSKMTIAAATLFMLSALFISMPALQGGNSVLNANPEAAAETTQPPITDLNTNTDANSASAAGNVASDANSSVVAPSNANAATANSNK